MRLALPLQMRAQQIALAAVLLRVQDAAQLLEAQPEQVGVDRVGLAVGADFSDASIEEGRPVAGAPDAASLNNEREFAGALDGLVRRAPRPVVKDA